MPHLKCPTCERKFDAETTTTGPFCSERCRLVDLGRWLGEDYSVPYEPTDEDEIPIE